MSDVESPASFQESDIQAQTPVDDDLANENANDDDDDLDLDSDLSEVDEAQFENFDPTTIKLNRQPRAVDSSNIGAIGVHKRKRQGSEGGEDRDEPRKEKRKKETKSRKPKRSRKTKDQLEQEEDNFSGGEQLEGKRNRKGRGDGEKRTKTVVTLEEEDETLTPEERTNTISSFRTWICC
jgi:transcription factor SPN1